MVYLRILLPLYLAGGDSCQTYDKSKKRYACLVIGNVGNFQLCTRDGIVVLTLLRGLLFPYPCTGFSYDLQSDVASQFHALV